MNLSRPVRWFLAIASGLALSFSFPSYNLPLLAWIAVALLMLAALGAPAREAALYGFINGALFYPLSVPWIDDVMRQYGNVGPFAAAGILALIALAGALFPIVFAILVSRAGKRSLGLACALAPFLWVALEFARGKKPPRRARGSSAPRRHRQVRPAIRAARRGGSRGPSRANQFPAVGKLSRQLDGPSRRGHAAARGP